MNATKNLAGKRVELLSEIKQFSGEQGVGAVDEYFSDLRKQVEKDVQRTPDAFGAGADKESQSRAVNETLEVWELNYLNSLTKQLRRKAGYVNWFGKWIHRSIITFTAYGVLAAVSLSYCFSKILSPEPGAWWKGLVGLAVAVGLGVAIRLRVKN